MDQNTAGAVSHADFIPRQTLSHSHEQVEGGPATTTHTRRHTQMCAADRMRGHFRARSRRSLLGLGPCRCWLPVKWAPSRVQKCLLVARTCPAIWFPPGKKKKKTISYMQEPVRMRNWPKNPPTCGLGRRLTAGALSRNKAGPTWQARSRGQLGRAELPVKQEAWGLGNSRAKQPSGSSWPLAAGGRR